MKKGILGRKLGMSQIFDEKGNVIPVTIVEAGPCFVTQIKTVAKEGYDSVQMGFGDVKEKKEQYKNVSQPVAKHCEKAGVSPKRYLHEFRFDSIEGYELGKEVLCSQFEVGDIVDVTGRTKGRGFTGVIKRWNAQRVGSMSHGTGPIHRSVGSMAANSDPSRVFKNKHMAGQYGNEQVTIKNLVVARIDKEKNLLFIKGGIPGANGSLVIVKA
ncbi:MAG: 50S ribosomal protein L3 [Clostridia bacterium]|nr:50S ribosomal protein L3 [Clostridia bacterium]